VGFALAAVLSCIASLPLAAQAPAGVSHRSFDHTIVVGGDWLQANALPLNRDAAQSFSGDLSWRSGNWAFSAGFMRIARDFSTVQGGTLSVGWVYKAGPIGFIPALSGFAGQSYESRDSTGYDFVLGATTGHEPRYSYSSGFSAGGGAGLTIEIPIYRIIGARIVGSEWVFSGSPLAKDRTRGVIGAGLTLRVR
jgi:hypothetical protein